MFCYAIIIICVLSGFAIILLRKREWLLFFNLLSWPLVTVGFCVPWVDPQCVSVVLSRHNQFFIIVNFIRVTK